ncbi:MAG: hypothetical protein WAT12_11010 [Candidatus Nitrotoga sp.]
MALYPLEDFKLLIASSNWSYFNERRPFKHLDKLSWNNDDLKDVLCSLDPEEDFRKTFQNQEVNDLPGISFVHADHYVIHWDMDDWVRRRYASKSTIELSLKIAIVENATGQLAGVVTFHISGSWD